MHGVRIGERRCGAPRSLVPRVYIHHPQRAGSLGSGPFNRTRSLPLRFSNLTMLSCMRVRRRCERTDVIHSVRSSRSWSATGARGSVTVALLRLRLRRTRSHAAGNGATACAERHSITSGSVTANSPLKLSSCSPQGTPARTAAAPFFTLEQAAFAQSCGLSWSTSTSMRKRPRGPMLGSGWFHASGCGRVFPEQGARTVGIDNVPSQTTGVGILFDASHINCVKKETRGAYSKYNKQP